MSLWPADRGLHPHRVTEFKYNPNTGAGDLHVRDLGAMFNLLFDIQTLSPNFFYSRPSSAVVISEAQCIQHTFTFCFTLFQKFHQEEDR